MATTTSPIKTIKHREFPILKFLLWFILALACGLIYAIPLHFQSPKMPTWSTLAAISGLTGAFGGFLFGYVAGLKDAKNIPRKTVK